VEYYLDNTPHTSVIKNGSSTDETFFGQKPISKKSVQIKKCTKFASKEPGKKNGGGDKAAGAAGPKYFEGRWKGFVGMLVVGGPVELDMKVVGNRATGVANFPTNDASERIDGTISGNVLRFSYVSEGETQNIVLTRKTENSLSFRNSIIGGTLTRY
jgi:hypothetical protein